LRKNEGGGDDPLSVIDPEKSPQFLDMRATTHEHEPNTDFRLAQEAKLVTNSSPKLDCFRGVSILRKTGKARELRGLKGITSKLTR
jgi:hypothetical protein